MGEPFKVELIGGVEDEQVSLYTQDGFTDFCRGPHLPSTGKIPAFKLLSLAGAYWRGDEKNKMLTRIYGTAYPSAEALREHLNFLEEVKRRDHRRLGRELDLFSISDEVGAGLVIYHPNGALLRYILEDFEKKEHLKRGYRFVIGPQILKVDLWKKSGHFENYRENMYFTKVDEVEYGLKPMNCLAHIMVYKSQIRSYRDLPLRYFELGTVNRHELSGVLHGLLRVREFTQDDAHIFCREDQLHDEINAIASFVADVMGVFGFEYELEISTRPKEHYIGRLEDWDRAERILKAVLDDRSLPYDINEGDGAFYGPKIDVKLKDALGRKWQCATIQLDFALPERFEPPLHGQGRPAQTSRHAPPGDPRGHGALYRHTDRALRGPLSAVARAAAGPHPHHHGRAGRLCGGAAADDRGRRLQGGDRRPERKIGLENTRRDDEKNPVHAHTGKEGGGNALGLRQGARRRGDERRRPRRVHRADQGRKYVQEVNS